MTSATTTASLTEAQLRSLVERFLQQPHRARLLVIAADPVWDGPEVLETERGAVRIVRGTSVLAVRVAMVDHPDDRLVILTRLPMHELGTEVAAQAWRGRVERPSPWNAVLTLFRATDIDPQLRSQRWMIELLVDRAPRGRGYPQAYGGVLTTDQAWDALCRFILGLPSAQPTAVDLVRWVGSEKASATLPLLSDEARQEVTKHLARHAGPAAPALLTLADHGHDHAVVALGLVVDALWPAPDPVAAALLTTKYLGDQPLADDAANEWGRAAVHIAEQVADDPDGELAVLLQRAEEILTAVQGRGTADSDWLPGGLDNRVDAFAQVFATALEQSDRASAVAEAERVLSRLVRHRQVRRDRLELCQAAVRLLRRTAAQTAEAEGDDLTALSWHYLDDGSWVDAARQRLAVGDTHPALAEAANRLLAEIDQQRIVRDRAYAASVAAQGTGQPPAASLEQQRPLRIEQVLDAVVAPLARQMPVLLLVLDGLSHAAAVPLLADVQKEGWRPYGPQGRRLPPVLAALPSITRVSRSSLLCGRLATGGPDVEAQGFGSHAGLVEASGGGSPPALFHKKALRTEDGHVAPAARAALVDPSQRVVGVVFNGVDDFLGDLEQLRPEEGLAGLPPLEELLNAALEGGRAIVLTSDHGHMLGSTRVVKGSGGERYRLPDRPPEDGEVELAGPRVLEGGGRIVAAADHEIRYYAAAKRGHHGGATPAEMLCPLYVLLGGSMSLEGWLPSPVTAPNWWDGVEQADVLSLGGLEAATPVVQEPAVSELAAPADSPQPGLFDEPAPPAPSADAGPPEWLSALLASPRLADQRQLAGRTAVDDDTLAAVLRVLVASGGTAAGTVLERALNTTPMRLRGTLNGVRTLLDIDGYPVLKIEPDGTAQLDLRRLAEQFEIDVPDAGGRP